MIITAKFLGPTNTKGSRIKVSGHKSGAKYYQWDHALNPGDNYEQAFKTYLKDLVMTGPQRAQWVMACTDTGMIATNSSATFRL